MLLWWGSNWNLWQGSQHSNVSIVLVQVSCTLNPVSSKRTPWGVRTAASSCHL
jgi:hypothetical protein